MKLISRSFLVAAHLGLIASCGGLLPSHSTNASLPASPTIQTFLSDAFFLGEKHKALLTVETLSGERSFALKINHSTEGHLLLAATGKITTVSNWKSFLQGSKPLALSGKIFNGSKDLLKSSYSDYSGSLRLQASSRASGVSSVSSASSGAELEMGFQGKNESAVPPSAAGLEFKFKPVDKLPLRIGTYNVENLWDDKSSPGVHYSDYDATSNWYDASTLSQKISTVTEAIALAGAPEILALEEIESAENSSRSLELLRPELEKMGYRFFALGQQSSTNPTAVTTAVVSRYPIVSNERLDFEFVDSTLPPKDAEELVSSSRDPQVATIGVGKRNVVVYASHWKSKRSGEAAGDRMRLAVAQLMMQDLAKKKALDPALDALIVGDFNTEYTDPAVVNGLNSTGDESAMLGAATDKMYNLWFELPENQRCSYSFNGRRGCIDNILVSQGLFEVQGFSLLDNSTRAVGHSGFASLKLMNGNGTPLRWQIQKAYDGSKTVTKHMGLGYSDHLPIVADFQVQSPNDSSSTKLKVKRVNPSTTDLGVEGPLDEIIPCATGLSEQDLKGTFTTLNQTCFQLANGPRDLKRGQDPKKVFIVANGREIILSATESFTTNQGWISDALLPLANSGKVQAVVGRLGIQNGELAVFPNKPWTQVKLLPSIPCTSPADATVQLKDISDFASQENACVSFSDAELLTQDTSTITSAMANVGEFTSIKMPAGLDPLSLRMQKSQAATLFPSVGRYQVSGFGRLTYFAPKKKWQIHFNSFGQNSGELSLVKALP